jgi:hypothetical protein
VWAWSGEQVKALIKAFNEIRDLFNNKVCLNGFDVELSTSTLPKGGLLHIAFYVTINRRSRIILLQQSQNRVLLKYLIEF